MSQPDSTTTPDAEPVTIPVPGFSPLPTTSPEDHHAGTTTPTTDSAGDGPADWADPGEAADPLATSPTDIESSTASTDRKKRKRGKRRASNKPPAELVELAHTIVVLVSHLVRAARGLRRPLLPEAWVADDEDQAAIGDPLARIAHRHSPVDGEGNADVIDGINAMVGVANYAAKNLPREGEPIPVDENGQPIPLEGDAMDPGWPGG